MDRVHSNISEGLKLFFFFSSQVAYVDFETEIEISFRMEIIQVEEVAGIE